MTELKGGFERITSLLRPDGYYYLGQTLERLSTGCSYKTILAEIPTSTTGTWDQISMIHQMMVAYEPTKAHVWLELVKSSLCTNGHHYSQDCWGGAFLGLLRAGTWLDKNVNPNTFQDNLLMSLAEVVAWPIKQSDSYRLDCKFAELLSSAIGAFVLIPTLRDKIVGSELGKHTLVARQALAANALKYIVANGQEGNLDPLKTFFVQRLSYTVVSTLPPLVQAQVGTLNIPNVQVPAEKLCVGSGGY